MLELMLWITKRKLRIEKLIPIAYPFRETLLALWPVEVHCLSSCNKLDQNHSKGINISFFCDLTGFSIFWSQIPAAEKNILFYTAIACGRKRQQGTLSEITQMFRSLLSQHQYRHQAATLLGQNLQPRNQS